MANPFKADLFRGLCVFVSLGIASVFAQTQSQQPPSRDRSDRGDRRGFNPEEMRNRMLAGIREQFEITNDEEWNIIAERIAKVMELRRSTMMGGMGMRGFGGGPDRASRSSGSSSGNPEVDGLRSAVQAKATDAELKARLTRLRELRKENEQRTEKAQEELRAVLTVRQEAILVMFGLLP